MSSPKRLFIIDISGYVFRSYYALPPMHTNAGQPVQAIYGLMRSLIKLIEDFKPEYILAVFDGIRGSSSRRAIYSEYKANRIKAPQELIEQLPLAYECCQALGIPSISLENHEADDLIGSAVLQAKACDWHCYVCSSDKDMLQLVSDNVWALHTHKDNRLIDSQTVKEMLGVHPHQVVDWLALCGDSSDNIPGVAGIGPKTAAMLLERYQSLEGIIEHLDELSAKQREKFDIQSARLSQQLALLKIDLDWQLDLNQSRYCLPPIETWMPFFEKMGFRSLLKSMQSIYRSFHGDTAFTKSPANEAKAKKTLELPKHRIIEPSIVGHSSLSTDEPDLFATLTSEQVKPDDSKNKSSYESPHEGWSYRSGNWQDLLQELSQLTASEKIFVDHLISVDTAASSKAFKNKKTDWVVGWKNHVYTVPAPTVEDKQTIEACLSLSHLWIGYETKPLQRQLLGLGIDGGICWKEDLKLAAYLFFADSRDLSPMALFNYFQITSFGEWLQNETQSLDGLSPETLIKNVKSFFQLYEQLQLKLEESALVDLYRNMELPVSQALAQIEINGCLVDVEQLKLQSSHVKADIEQLEKQIQELTHQSLVNLNSPKQLAQLLFEQLALPVIKKTKTGASTDAYSLEQLKDHHPVIEKIIKYRELEKLRSTYLEALPQCINSETRRIHPKFEQTGTATGRLSCHEPNLQNIPVRTAEGLKIRKAFIAPSNCVLLSADYSQIELRIMAHLSQDKALIKAFESDEDIHRYTASIVFNVASEAISDEQRSLAKAVNFGILYGQQAFGLAKQLGISLAEASSFISVYFQRYEGVRAYIEDCKKKAIDEGFVTTLLGRRRYIPEIRSPKAVIRQLGERLSVNTPVQGSAADLIKIAMVDIASSLKNGSKKLILQVHDELIFEVPEQEVDTFSQYVKEKMESVYQLSVPLRVNIGIGKNWMEC